MPYYNISLSEIRKNVEKRKRRYFNGNDFLFEDSNYTIGFIKEVKNNFGEILTRIGGNIPISLPAA